MSYTLVIVESPAKCSKIEKFLGPGYKCLASFGHLTKLSSLKNIDIENNFKLTFNIIDEKSNQIQKLQKAINNSTETYII
jgi:DNA topoisomerase-1